MFKSRFLIFFQTNDRKTLLTPEQIVFQPFKRQTHKTVKHIQIIRRQKPTNCLSVFDNFVGFVLKGLRLWQV